jgi:hypothetical protein
LGQATDIFPEYQFAWLLVRGDERVDSIPGIVGHVIPPPGLSLCKFVASALPITNFSSFAIAARRSSAALLM